MSHHTDHLRIATWNIWAKESRPEERLPAIVATIDEVAPDILALQECWADADAEQARTLAEMCGFPHVAYGSRLDIGYKIGNALLSKHPIVEQTLTDLPGYEGDDLMGCIVSATCEVRGLRVPVATTHLDFRKHHGALRVQQVGRLMETVDRHRGADFPSIVCGDFNAVPTADEIRAMRGHTAAAVGGLAFHDCWDHRSDVGDPGYTWSLANPNTEAAIAGYSRIDYVFVEAGRFRDRGVPRGTRIFGDGPHGGTWPSDHFGVVTDLSLPDTTG